MCSRVAIVPRRHRDTEHPVVTADDVWLEAGAHDLREPVFLCGMWGCVTG